MRPPRWVTGAIPLLVVIRVAASAEPHVFRREGDAMGTRITLSAWTEDEAGTEKAFDVAFEEIVRIEHLMTDWDRPGNPPSDLVRINRSAGKGPVVVASETFEVIAAGQKMSALSHGAFDLSYAALRGLWQFDEDMERRIPPRAKIERARRMIGYRNVRLDAERKTVELRRKGMRLGLGGIAKGYAVDRAGALLLERGVQNFMIQAGGDLLVRGAKGDKPWMVGIRDPRSSERERFFAVAPIRDHAFSTAGDYERSFVLDGKRYHHILDPKTGYPANRCRSVTIFAPSAMIADSLDDAVFILGPEKGLPLVEATPGAGAVIVDAQNQVHISKRLKGVVKVVDAPSPGI